MSRSISGTSESVSMIRIRLGLAVIEDPHPSAILGYRRVRFSPLAYTRRPAAYRACPLTTNGIAHEGAPAVQRERMVVAMPPINRRDMRSNRLLRALPRDDYERLQRHLQLVSFTAKQSVYEPDEPVRSVYVPLNGALDLVKVLESGESVSVATLGMEGVVGHAIILGTDRMPAPVLCGLPSTCAMLT